MREYFYDDIEVAPTYAPYVIIGRDILNKLEIFYDTALAAAAAQAQQLDSSATKMKKEMLLARLKYRKARRSDIDKSLREVFSAQMMAAK